MHRQRLFSMVESLQFQFIICFVITKPNIIKLKWRTQTFHKSTSTRTVHHQLCMVDYVFCFYPFREVWQKSILKINDDVSKAVCNAVLKGIIFVDFLICFQTKQIMGTVLDKNYALLFIHCLFNRLLIMQSRLFLTSMRVINITSFNPILK